MATATGGPPRAIGARHRIAWLLRVNRTLGPHAEYASLPAFARAFRGGSYPRDVSPSTVSRWETAQAPVPRAAVRRYEELLALPPDLLVATVETTARYLAPSALERPPLPGGPQETRATEDLLDHALSDDVMSGAEWGRLTDGLCASGAVTLMPSGVWSLLTRRLVEEMVIADGIPWMLRFEALNRLLNHPRGSRHAIAVCAALAADPANHAATEVICALDNTAHPDAAARVLAALRRPAGPRSQQGAHMACLRKIRYRHFSPGQLHVLARELTHLPDDGDAIGQVAPLAGGLLALHPQFEPTLGALRVPPEHDGDRRIGVSARRVAASAEAAAVREPLDGAALTALVTEMLQHPEFDARLYTALLLAATPYRAGLADALVSELARPVTVRDTGLAVPLLGALRVLGGAPRRGPVERLALAGQAPWAAVAAAVHGLGHIAAAQADVGFWVRALRHHAARRQTEGDAAAEAGLRGLVYAMGMADRYDLLAALGARPGTPYSVRSAAAWWLDISPHVRLSARR
ncbi:hypothetical protein [Streptomyces sp. TP-A0356]|uniref:hypothetical protein n=1 Tax=Streptomyces sp. TP-A0356 TaxID=1359208 RepID=UPI0006E186B3|nr:hypothetical protein [Streptomyces sp. TP-A0356]